MRGMVFFFLINFQMQREGRWYHFQLVLRVPSPAMDGREISPDKEAVMQAGLKRPVGTFYFEYISTELFKPSDESGIVFQAASGKHVHRVERDSELRLHFFHSSPGTGTRVATIDLTEVTPVERLVITLAWCPEEIWLGIETCNHERKGAKGAKSNKQFRVGEDGGVHQIGDQIGTVSGVYFYQGSTPVLSPTALDLWKDTLEALELLETGESDKGHTYELVVSNLSLVMLATGFETYTKKRFIELLHEGIEPDHHRLMDAFLQKSERSREAKERFAATAMNINLSVAEYLASKRMINFQNYKQCKIAYNKAYGLKFGDLKLDNNEVANVQKYLRYRHKIIHVSPQLGCLNMEDPFSDGPAIPSKTLARNARECFSSFVDKLHSASLKLRPVKTPS